jgi:hypothetical protein
MAKFYMDSLKNLTTEELRKEVSRRWNLLEQGICYYCGRSYKSPTCGNVQAHEEAGSLFYRDFRIVAFGDFVTLESEKFQNISLSFSRYSGHVTYSADREVVSDGIIPLKDDTSMFHAAVDWFYNQIQE